MTTDCHDLENGRMLKKILLKFLRNKPERAFLGK